MTHFGMICPPVTGHVNPLAALGRTLMGRGHRVTFFQIQDLELAVRAQKLAFIALGTSEVPSGLLSRSVDKMRHLTGAASLKFAVAGACQISEIILKYGPEAVRSSEIQVLLVDQNEPAGASVAEHLKLPFISVCTSLPLNREPAIPPPFVGWKYSASPWAIIRNRVGYAIADHFIAPIHATLNSYRARWGLTPIRSPNDSFSKVAQMAQMPREFDFPKNDLSPTFHYLGPWFDTVLPPTPFPFEKLDGRPFIYGSLGTLQDQESHYFEIMAEACRGLDIQLVLSLGHTNDHSGRNWPDNALVIPYAPQLELLSRATLTITHGGMNTTQQSLYFGVPLIAIPLTHDQPAIAARLAATGAGLVISPRRLTVRHLRDAIIAVLPKNSSYRLQARRLQEASRAAGGVERAALIAEGIC